MNRIAVAGSVALAVTGALSMGLATADAAKRKKARFQNEKNLVVTLATPTLNQEVLPDLSDPGLNGVIEIRFSSPLKKRDVINDQNTFNRLTERVEFLDSTFNRMPGTPTLRRNRFIFNPRTAENGGVLAQGQYTVNIRRNVRNRRGRMLNFGTADFTTTFSVGTDVYNPVLRRMSPLDGQTNIGLQQKLVASFNEPIDIACAGGTSMVGGFIEVFREEFAKIDFPIPVGRIFRSEEALTAVAKGCLVAAAIGEE